MSENGGIPLADLLLEEAAAGSESMQAQYLHLLPFLSGFHVFGYLSLSLEKTSATVRRLKSHERKVSLAGLALYRGSSLRHLPTSRIHGANYPSLALVVSLVVVDARAAKR